MTNRIKKRGKRGNAEEAAKALKLIIGNRRTDVYGRRKPKHAKTKGLRGSEISLSAYKTAADKIDWQNQKDMYQQGHEFFLNYHHLYADNKNNEIGEFLELHYSLVMAYKGGKMKTNDTYQNSQKAAIEKTIATLEKSQKYNNSEVVAKTITTLKKSLKYL